jgi:hypothetical protein
LLGTLCAAQQPEQGCTFRTQSSEFLTAQSRARDAVSESVRKFRRLRSATRGAAAPVRQNFVDDEIFSRLEAARVNPATPSTDEEFCRRIFLDLTGRIPAPDILRAFLADTAGSKREELIDRLLASPEFADKWAVWFADLIQNTERLSTSGRAPQVEGRNKLDIYLRTAIGNGKTIREIVTELITGTGNNYFTENGPANYPVLASTAMGPAQDTYDMMLSRTASQFLGISNYDCLLCHNGRGHLTGINLWGERITRGDAQRMAAHFARMRLNNGAPRGAVQSADVLYNSTDVQDVEAGAYNLNTTNGNRPVRLPIGAERSLTPEYRDGAKPAAGENWRAFYASKLTTDPMFGRNFANRIWKRFFGLGLADPVDTLDPARLDPANPPPAPWTLQATHPELLEKLAKFFFDNNTDLRVFIRLLVQSSAYQLSSSYDGEWKYEYVTLFPRHYPRRLDAEEVHDAVVAASGVPVRYTWPIINNQTVPRNTPLPQSEPVEWAMKLPDINEPRNNPAMREFMRTFYRGNRDTAERLQSGSLQQQLSLMNSSFILDRIRITTPTLARISRIADNVQAIEELFLAYLSRRPTEEESASAAAHLTRVRRNDAIQDLAWVCVNKIDFLYSY